MNSSKFTRILLSGLALLTLAGCGRSVAVGERFMIRDGETVRVRGTDVSIAAEQIIDGLDGSQEIGDGSVSLRVILEGEVKGETELYLEARGTASAGGYDIHFERVHSDAKGLSCELIVTRR